MSYFSTWFTNTLLNSVYSNLWNFKFWNLCAGYLSLQWLIDWFCLKDRILAWNSITCYAAVLLSLSLIIKSPGVHACVSFWMEEGRFSVKKWLVMSKCLITGENYDTVSDTSSCECSTLKQYRTKPKCFCFVFNGKSHSTTLYLVRVFLSIIL